MVEFYGLPTVEYHIHKMIKDSSCKRDITSHEKSKYI